MFSTRAKYLDVIISAVALIIPLSLKSFSVVIAQLRIARHHSGRVVTIKTSCKPDSSSTNCAAIALLVLVRSLSTGGHTLRSHMQSSREPNPGEYQIPPSIFPTRNPFSAADKQTRLAASGVSLMAPLPSRKKNSFALENIRSLGISILAPSPRNRR